MLIIASYHKTGTVLFQNIWNHYAKSINKLPKQVFTFYDHFNNTSDDYIKNNKCVVIIRNPYEIIMSGIRYHKKTLEEWCSKKIYINSMTYKEYINSLNKEDQIMFEMRNIGKLTIDNIYHDIKNRNYNNNVLFIKIEDLYIRSNIKDICLKIYNHLDKEIQLDKLIESFHINLNINFNRTFFENKYTYQDYFNKKHYIEFNRIFKKDTMSVLDY